jgi:hypothetical protein
MSPNSCRARYDRYDGNHQGGAAAFLVAGVRYGTPLFLGGGQLLKLSMCRLHKI